MFPSLNSIAASDPSIFQQAFHSSPFPHNFPPPFSLFLYHPSARVIPLNYSFTALSFCLASPLLSFAAPLARLSRIDSRKCMYSYIIDLSIFNGPTLPRVGAIVCRFRWFSDAVRACCHSVLLRVRAHDLGSALTAIPGETDMSISPWYHMQNKLKIPDRLYWANVFICNDCTQPTTRVHFRRTFVSLLTHFD